MSSLTLARKPTAKARATPKRGKGSGAGAKAHPARSEHVEAVTLMRMVALHTGQHPELAYLYAIPNGGDRHPAVAAKLKGEGARAGVPDYHLPLPRGECAGLWIELKSMTGYPSREQREWIEWLRAHGHRAEVCRGWEAAWRTICDYLGIEARL